MKVGEEEMGGKEEKKVLEGFDHLDDRYQVMVMMENRIEEQPLGRRLEGDVIQRVMLITLMTTITTMIMMMKFSVMLLDWHRKTYLIVLLFLHPCCSLWT